MTEDMYAVQSKLKEIKENATQSLAAIIMLRSPVHIGTSLDDTLRLIDGSLASIIRFCDYGIKECREGESEE